MSAFDLTGRAGIVTGGASGLGAAEVKVLRAAGAKVAVLDIDAEAVEALADDAADAAVVADVSDAASVRAGFERAVSALGRLDFLVNNAGIRAVQRFEDYPLDLWTRHLAVNLTGPFLCSQAALPYMRRLGKGKIVNIASTTAELALRNRAAYVTTKHGVRGLTKAIATELGPEGIYCNAIAPGVFETPLTADYFTDESFAQLIRDQTPLGRWAQPDELGDPVVFLCSDASDFVQGATLFVDGGWVASKGY